jgi:hypothetical protein
VKKLLSTTDSGGKKILSLNKDYYVNKDFTGENTNYCLVNNMVYQKFQAFLCQDKGDEKDDLALS